MVKTAAHLTFLSFVGPADVNGDMVLRVNLHALEGQGPGNVRGALLASAEKPLDLAADLELEVDDICDALATIGVNAVSVALRFDVDGQTQDVRPYQQPA